MLRGLGRLSSTFCCVGLTGGDSSLGARTSTCRTLCRVGGRRKRLGSTVLCGSASLVLCSSVRSLGRDTRVDRVLGRRTARALRRTRIVGQRGCATFLVMAALLLVTYVAFVFLCGSGGEGGMCVGVRYRLEGGRVRGSRLGRGVGALVSDGACVTREGGRLGGRRLGRRRIRL